MSRAQQQQQQQRDSPNRDNGNQEGEEPNQENISDFIAVLEEHQRQCEQEGKYVEAEMAKNRISELR